MYEVFDNKGQSHGCYDTIGEARGCAEFDRLDVYTIWFGSELVADERGAY